MVVWVLEGNSIYSLVGVLVWLWVDWGFVRFLVSWLVSVPRRSSNFQRMPLFCSVGAVLNPETGMRIGSYILNENTEPAIIGMVPTVSVFWM